MSGLVLNNVTKEFGTFTAVNNLELTLPDGTFVCLLGPSGCGKTTLLQHDRGARGADRTVSIRHRWPGHDAMCPRTSAIWAWCSSRWRCFRTSMVGENIAYPLAHSRRIEGAIKQRARVDELLSS